MVRRRKRERVMGVERLEGQEQAVGVAIENRKKVQRLGRYVSG